jgi:hypothetical protein
MAMNYPLNDLRTLLISEGYENIFVNHLPELSQRIVLMEEPSGRIETTQTVRRTDVAIYVRETSPSQARATSQSLYKFLCSYQGKSAGVNATEFLRISITNAPFYWGYNTNTKATEFMFNISILHIDNDLTTNA